MLRFPAVLITYDRRRVIKKGSLFASISAFVRTSDVARLHSLNFFKIQVWCEGGGGGSIPQRDKCLFSSNQLKFSQKF
jgi:hypothetical protein